MSASPAYRHFVLGLSTLAAVGSSVVHMGTPFLIPALTASGLSLPAAPGSVDGKGVAMVRPESVNVTADPSGTATVTSVSFLGAISRVHLSAADGAVLMAQMASSAARDLQPGERVTVAVDSDAVLVTPA